MAILSVDFDKNATELYTAICAGESEKAITIANEDPVQAKTWVVKYDTEDPVSVIWRFLPIHSACARQPDETLVEALLVAYPGAVSEKDDQGFLPVHYACGNRANDTVINMLLILNPQAAAVPDPFGGKLPLHHLSQWGCYSAGVVNMLLAAYPEAIHEKDFAGYTPIDLAKSANYPGRNVVITALNRCMVVCKKRNSKNTFGDLEISKELENIKDDEERIMKLSEEVNTLRKETKELQEQLDEIREKCDHSLSNQKEKLEKCQYEHTSLRKELNMSRTKYHKSEQEHSDNLDGIQFCKKEIVSLKEEKVRTIKERDTIGEKLNLKTKTSEHTVRKLNVHVEEQKIELKMKYDTLASLETMVATMEKEMEAVIEADKEFNVELEMLRNSKNVSEKMDVLNICLIKLRTRYEAMKQTNITQDRTFKETIVEKEQKILEFAQMEEKLRARTSEEHEMMVQELNEQFTELQNLMVLVKS